MSAKTFAVITRVELAIEVLTVMVGVVVRLLAPSRVAQQQPHRQT